MATRTPDPTLNEIIRVLQDAMRRIRLVEESQRALEAKQVSTENNVFRQAEDVRARVQANETVLKDINTKFLKVENELSNIKKVLSKAAMKNELDEFKNYLDLLSPLRTHYMTETEVKKMLEESQQKPQKK